MAAASATELFECSNGVVAVAQRGINGRERESIAAKRAFLFNRPYDLYGFAPPPHPSIDPTHRAQTDAAVARGLLEFLHVYGPSRVPEDRCIVERIISQEISAGQGAAAMPTSADGGGGARA